VVNEEEQLEIPDKGISLLANACNGSPRRALTMMSKCRGLTDIKEIRQILQEPDTEEGDVIELCRALLKGITFMEALQIVKRLEGQNPESIRLVLLAYMSKVLIGSKSTQNAEKILAIMEAFSKPFYQSEKFAPLLLALGSILL
jgi:DNA polymerase III gamma/tau subunit